MYVWCGRGSLWTWVLFDINCAVLTYFIGFDFLAVMRRESGDLIHQLPIRLPSLFYFISSSTQHTSIIRLNGNMWRFVIGTFRTHDGLLFFTCSFNFHGSWVRLGVHLLLRKHLPYRILLFISVQSSYTYEHYSFNY